MSWRIEWSPGTKSDLDNLDGSLKPFVLKVIQERLSKDPEKYGEPLTGSLFGLRKYRVRFLRVVYAVSPEKREVIIVAIGMRKAGEVYETATERIRYLREQVEVRGKKVEEIFRKLADKDE
ncbi:MAG: type II toxin-antitoxin system RelE/ParE family toxin [Thermaerobacter sp.]|jgi:mRNA interferase RelE/StbE|nr:type II toxin-antitoxin system RelE/ParE family toxin [Thermaerobacter sp.]